MDDIFIKPKAKINLSLNILGKREDGYHELESVFQSIYLYDEMYIKKSNTQGIQLFCNIKHLEKNNILINSYNKLKDLYPKITGITINLKKKIPIEAGLGGGSSDCAYFILAMNKLFNLNMPFSTIITLGSSLGADVIPCMAQNTIVGRGIGEKISYIKDISKYYIILIKPNISISTKDLFNKFDNLGNIVQKNNTENIIKSLENNNIFDISSNLYNVFEEVLEEEIIFNTKDLLKNLGATGVLMTGSGSCIFGLFENKHVAKEAYYKIKSNEEAYICIPYRSNKFKEYFYDK